MKRKNLILAIGAAFTFMVSCQPKEKPVDKEEEVIEVVDTTDVHTFAKPDEAVVKHLSLNINVDFDQHIISGIAGYEFIHSDSCDSIIFDVDHLKIKNVLLDDGSKAEYYTGKEDQHLGQPLVIKFKPETKRVDIEFETPPTAGALQWLNPQQTKGKKHPFLFTQSQAILARTWLPCQDSPGIRYTYDATVKVPKGLLAVMSASNPIEKNEESIYTFEMKQPVPSYLMALAVGDIAFKPIGERTGIYAEPEMLDPAVWEFADMEKMLIAAEELYGTYAWERYDLIVLPPSFPFGGMENPRLTFCTPTVIAGDRSLTSLVAHELAHSWSGNLVTNQTWNDFWLNEGFTVYFERRIMEALYGKDYADMLATLGHQDLEHELDELDPKDTHLKLDLENRNPDDGMTNIAYEKGYFFLRLLEEAYGRERFDAFLKEYFQSHAFETMNTERYMEYLRENLLNQDSFLIDGLKIDKWIYGPGLPDNCPKVVSSRFQAVGSSLGSWADGSFSLDELNTKDWSSLEWLNFIRKMPTDLTAKQLEELDKAFNFTNSGNSEILAAWFEHTIRAGYAPADAAVEKFLISVGRRKFLVPIYKALVKADPSKAKALEIYKKARENYHSVSTETLDKMLGYQA